MSLGKVNIHPVTYKLNGLDISANVYTPANYDAKKVYPTVVVAHNRSSLVRVLGRLVPTLPWLPPLLPQPSRTLVSVWGSG
jgi:hypothetical protein